MLNWDLIGHAMGLDLVYSSSIRAKAVCCHAKSSAPVEYDTATEINVVPSSSVYKPVMASFSVRS
jgi:hypothetical protein